MTDQEINELIYSTVRGKYGDRNDAYYEMPAVDDRTETIMPTSRYAEIADDNFKKQKKREKEIEEAERDAEEMAFLDAMKNQAVIGKMNRGYKSMLREKLKDGELMTDKELWTLSDGNEDDFDRLRMERDMDLKKAIDEDRLKPHSLEAREYPSKLEAFLFGYGPNEEEDGFFDKLGEGEIPSVKDAASEAAYFVPVVGEVKYGANILDRIREGGMPGFVETAMAVPFFGPRAVKLGKSAYRAYKTAPSRRFAKEFRSKDYKTPMIGYEKKVFDDKGRELQRIDVYPWD